MLFTVKQYGLKTGTAHQLCIFLHKINTMRLFYLSVLLLSVGFVNAQDSVAVSKDSTMMASANTSAVLPTWSIKKAESPFAKPSPYKTSFRVDGPVLAAGLGLTFLGYNMIVNKDGLTTEELANKKIEDIPWFDRGNAGYYNDKANDASYIPFYASFGIPLVASLIDKNQRSHFVQVNTMFLETMAISGAIYTLTAGAISRSRPLVYPGSTASTDSKTSNNAQRSFFAGHVSATASATFFAAQVFSDFNPDSRAKPWVWAGAAAIPAVVGYLRYQAGQHFLSDILVGYGVGMSCGIFVPRLHRTAAFRNLTVLPQIGDGYKGLAFVYKL
jgi:membrane-associated phospholipid phosphatase